MAKKVHRSSESENAKISGEKKMLTTCFNTKGIIHHEFVPENQTVNSKFHKK
jgi:hypothetical protein